MRNIRQSIMRVGAIAALMAALSVPAEAQIVKGEKSAGAKLGYVTKNQSAMAGVFFRYSFSDHFRLSPEIGYTFRHKDLDAFTVDVNAHIPFNFTGETVAFYPLAGLNFSSWNRYYSADGINESSRRNRFGVNVGAGFDLRCSNSIKLLLEAKYCLTKRYTTATISAGVCYLF